MGPETSGEAQDFDCRAVDFEGGTRLIVRGELDLATGPRLQHSIETAEQRGIDPVVVDLSQTRFIDSSGLGMLVSAHRRAVEGGWRFALMGTRGEVARILELTGLASQFEVLAPEDTGRS